MREKRRDEKRKLDRSRIMRENKRSMKEKNREKSTEVTHLNYVL